MEISGINISEKNFDVAIIGGGGSGLRASLEISKSGLVGLVGLGGFRRVGSGWVGSVGSGDAYEPRSSSKSG